MLILLLRPVLCLLLLLLLLVSLGVACSVAISLSVLALFRLLQLRLVLLSRIARTLELQCVQVPLQLLVQLRRRLRRAALRGTGSGRAGRCGCRCSRCRRGRSGLRRIRLLQRLMRIALRDDGMLLEDALLSRLLLLVVVDLPLRLERRLLLEQQLLRDRRQVVDGALDRNGRLVILAQLADSSTEIVTQQETKRRTANDKRK